MFCPLRVCRRSFSLFPLPVISAREMERILFCLSINRREERTNASHQPQRARHTIHVSFMPSLTLCDVVARLVCCSAVCGWNRIPFFFSPSSSSSTFPWTHLGNAHSDTHKGKGPRRKKKQPITCMDGSRHSDRGIGVRIQLDYSGVVGASASGQPQRN